MLHFSDGFIVSIVYKTIFCYYSRLTVIRTYTYSNNSVIRTEIAFPFDQLIQLCNSGKDTLGYSNSSYSNFQLFEPRASYRLNHSQLFDFLLLGDRRVRTLIFMIKTLFLQKIRFQYSCLITLFKLFEKFLQKFNILLRSTTPQLLQKSPSH